MKIGLILLLCSIPLVVVSCWNPMEHAHCDDTEIKRVPSPDGKFVIVIYNRRCSGNASSTYAEVEDPSVQFSWPGHPEICQLVTLVTLSGTYQQLDAAWKDAKHIEISSTDELNPDYGLSKNETCNDIAVNYKFKFKPRPVQEAPDKKTIDEITEAISQTQDCIDRWAGAGHSDYFWKLVKEKQHREALEILCTNLWLAECPISKTTFGLISQAASTMGIAQSYLDNLKPFVQP